MMKGLEKLRKFITRERECGNLHPGGRLPSLRKLTEIVDCSYVTVQTAMNQLEKEKIVEKRGAGIFLSGANRIKVRVNIIETDLSVREMEMLLKKHLANTELYLDLDIHGYGEIKTVSSIEDMERSYSAIVSISAYGSRRSEDFQADKLSDFPGYRKHLTALNCRGMKNTDRGLPFIQTFGAMGINRNLMDKIGFDYRKRMTGFKWWEEYTALCRKQGIVPASRHRNRKYFTLLSEYLYLLLSVCGYSKEKIMGKEPYFNTPQGKRFLEIVAGVKYIDAENSMVQDFYRNQVPLAFNIGSWIAVQNHSPQYPYIKVDSLDIMPYSGEDGRRIFISNPRILEASFRKGLSEIEKRRVWELMKLMTSRDFQLDYCNKTGFLAAVKDILPFEYYWNRTGQFNSFFPEDDDILIASDDLFNRTAITALSTILEMYAYHEVKLETAAALMDLKKEFPKLNG